MINFSALLLQSHPDTELLGSVCLQYAAHFLRGVIGALQKEHVGVINTQDAAVPHIFVAPENLVTDSDALT